MCPYDKYALRVYIDGSHVGYLKKGFNKSIFEEIENGTRVDARVKAVLWGGPGKNNGIALSLHVDNGPVKTAHTEDLGASVESGLAQIEIYEHTLPEIAYENSDSLWIEFLEQRKNLPAKMFLPKEPNYHDEYKQNRSWLQKLWGEKYDMFKLKRKAEWISECSVPKTNNNTREKMLRDYNSKRFLHEYELKAYASEKNLNRLLRQIGVIAASKSSDKRSQYVTLYEKTIYDLLSPHAKNLYHQVTIGDRSIDILLIVEDLSMAWAIEIDGGIHRRKVKIERDKETLKVLKEKGVSLMRVPNYFISRDSKACCEKMLKLMGIQEKGSGDSNRRYFQKPAWLNQ